MKPLKCPKSFHAWPWAENYGQTPSCQCGARVSAVRNEGQWVMRGAMYDTAPKWLYAEHDWPGAYLLTDAEVKLLNSSVVDQRSQPEDP